MSDQQPVSGPAGSPDSGNAPPPPPPAGSSAVPPPPAGGSSFPPPGTGPQTPGWGAPPPGPSWQAPPVSPPGMGTRPGELLDRFVARLIDHVLIGVVNAIIVSAIVVGLVLGTDGNGVFGYGDSLVANFVGAVLSTLLGLGYFVVMETQQGRTLGKMVMSLHVERVAGGKPTVSESVKRNIWMVFPLAGILPVIGGLLTGLAQLVAVILIAVGINADPVRRRPWTDKLAGTQVVKEG